MPGSEDRLAISDRIQELGEAVDDRDWARVRDCLAPKLRVDYTSLFGGEAREMTADGLVETWKSLLPGFDRVHHLTGPVRAEVTGAEAHARCAVTATHVLGARRWVVGGHYELGLRKDGETWRIESIRLDTAFVDGDPFLPEAARRRVSGPHRPDPPPWA